MERHLKSTPLALAVLLGGLFFAGCHPTTSPRSSDEPGDGHAVSNGPAGDVVSVNRVYSGTPEDDRVRQIRQLFEQGLISREVYEDKLRDMAARPAEKPVEPAKDTRLHRIAACQSGESVYEACLNGADVCARNESGRTAHEVAVAGENFKALGQLCEAELWSAPLNPARFAVDCVATNLEGGTVRLASLRGHTAALFFFCAMPWNKNFNYTWLDYAQKLHESPEGRSGRLIVLAVTPDAPQATRDFLAQHGWTFETVCDHGDQIRRAIGACALPAVLLDETGRIVWQRRMWQRNHIEDSGLFLAARHLQRHDFEFRVPAESRSTNGRSESVLFDFENGFGGWQRKGGCWESEPAADALYPGLVKGYAGLHFMSTLGHKGPRATGLAVSPEFEITRPYLHFLVGGGDLPDHCAVVLVCDGCAVRRASGGNIAELLPTCWDVRDLTGRKAHLELFDAGTDEPRDFVMLDQVVASDSIEIPDSFAGRFDPDDPDCVAMVADRVPASYRKLQEGDFHVESEPGRTYRLEQSRPVRWPDGSADWLEMVVDFPPTHLAHTVHSMSMTVDAGAKTWQGRTVMTGRPVMSKASLCDIPAAMVPDRRGSAKVTCELTINNLHLVEGAPSSPPSIPASMRNGLTASYHAYPYSNPWMKQYMSAYRLWRFKGESDAAFLLRTYRHFQRYFVYANVNWGGWPYSQGWALDSFERHSADCGQATLLAMLLRANGIPALSGQGAWAGDNGAEVGAHVRTLVFLRKSGWIWLDVGPDVNGISPFSIGSRWGDNFFSQGLGDIPADSIIPRPPGAKDVQRGWFDGGEWWRSWVISSTPVTAVAQVKSSKAASPKATRKPSSEDRIREAGSLLDQGLISREMYDRK